MRLSRSGGGHRLLGQSKRRGFVTKAHIGQREITNSRPPVFRLFFEESFQLTTRLPPTFLGGGMVAPDFLRPAQPKAQSAIEIRPRPRIRLAQYFL